MASPCVKDPMELCECSDAGKVSLTFPDNDRLRFWSERLMCQHLEKYVGGATRQTIRHCPLMWTRSWLDQENLSWLVESITTVVWVLSLIAVVGLREARKDISCMLNFVVQVSGPSRNGFPSLAVEELEWPSQSSDLNPTQHLGD